MSVGNVERLMREIVGTDEQDDDDYYHSSHSRYYPHGGNSSITTSVTIHVTPEHYHLLNWAILWVGFLLGIGFASYQVRLENQRFASKKRYDLEQQQGGVQDGDGFSTAEWTRSRVSFSPIQCSVILFCILHVAPSPAKFRRLLLAAMVSRAIMIPVQMYSKPLWAQFVADTLPEMNFASAWILLVTFFVQLVAIATGTGNSTQPGWVIQIIAYGVYAVVLGTYFWNPVASVLLYALLCCIYAALLGTSLFVCPRLLWVLKGNWNENKNLSFRLLGISVLCLFALGARTVGFARKVVAPPEVVSWWWQYGILDLIPSILLLLLTHPKSQHDTVGNNAQGTQSIRASRSYSPSAARISGKGSHRRQDSQGSQKRQTESTPLLKANGGYGAH